MMKKKYIFLICFGVLAVGFILYRAFFVFDAVQAVTVEKGKLVTLIYATGTVTPDSLATLNAEVGGTIVYANGIEGSRHRKNEVMLRTDAADLELRIKQSETDIATASVDLQDKKTNYERLQNLYPGGSVTKKDFDAAKREYDLGKIALERSQILLAKEKEALSKSEIRAPFDCLVISSRVNIGDNIPANKECFRVIAPASLLVEAEVDEQDLGKVFIGQKCLVAFDAFKDQKFDGKVYRIVPETDKTTKTSKVFVKLEQIPNNLNTGMTSTINIIAGVKENILVIPKTSIVMKNSRNFVFVIENQRLHETEVSLGLNEGKYIEVTGGLSAGSVIVTEPKPEYINGKKVHIKQ